MPIRILLAIATLALAAAAYGEEPPKADQIYATRCSLCHGERGAGDGMAGSMLRPPPPNFTNSEYWKKTTTEQVRNAIANGKPGTAMTPFNSSLSAAEIDALVVYVKSFAPK